MNDNDREEWIDNDEDLYNWWKAEGGSIRNFIRANKEKIDKYIKAMMQPPCQACSHARYVSQNPQRTCSKHAT